VTKSEFQKLRTKCPWYYVSHGEPRCTAQITGIFGARHCSKKNCAVVYWIDKEKKL